MSLFAISGICETADGEWGDILFNWKGSVFVII